MKQSVLFFQRISLLLSALLLLAGCSSSDSEEQEKGGESQPEIRLNADSWQVMEHTRATTFDNASALQTEAHFTCTVYNANSITTYITPTTVDWVDTEWLFIDGTHRWPSSGNLDFFAYMPQQSSLESVAPYITGIAYTTARDPQITCTYLPMTNSGQEGKKEFVYSLITDQNKDTKDEYDNPGVTLRFQHPFARIRFAWSGGSAPDGMTLNSVTFKNLKKSGTYTHSGGWTPSGDNDNFTSNTIDGTTWYLVIPQTFAGNIEVNASWTDWGESIAHTVSTSLPSLTWAPGTSYTYTFTITETDLIVNTEKFTEQW